MPANAPTAPHKPRRELLFALLSALVAGATRLFRLRRQRRKLDMLIRRCERDTFAEGEALKWRLRLKRK